jgi:hypothetical protein
MALFRRYAIPVAGYVIAASAVPLHAAGTEDDLSDLKVTQVETTRIVLRSETSDIDVVMEGGEKGRPDLPSISIHTSRINKPLGITCRVGARENSAWRIVDQGDGGGPTQPVEPTPLLNLGIIAASLINQETAHGSRAPLSLSTVESALQDAIAACFGKTRFAANDGWSPA